MWGLQRPSPFSHPWTCRKPHIEMWGLQRPSPFSHPWTCRKQQLVIGEFKFKVHHVMSSRRHPLGRFPEDFMFQLTTEKYEFLRFHFGILKRDRHSKYLPYAFTEQGFAMLSSVLRISERGSSLRLTLAKF